MHRTAFLVAFSLVASIVACSASSEEDSAPMGDEVDQGAEQDITAAKSQIKGSWTISSESQDLTSNVAYDFRPNGDFFRDSNRVLNGVLRKGAPRPVSRDAGHYTVNTSKKQITLHITSPIKATEVVNFEYTPGRILNGVFLPGKEPDTRAHLTLRGEPAPRSHVAFPALKFDHAESYCTSDNDCKDEAKDATWLEGHGAPGIVCDANNRICLAAVN